MIFATLVEAHKLRGVLIEPQPAAFARLQKTYRDQPQVTLLQAAIAEQEGTRDLYCKRGEASMVASFDREHLRRHNVADREIVTQQVACHTVESALRAAGLSHVDLMQIDAEGYDWPIIRSIDFTRLRPRILRFEYRHMSSADADECLALLAATVIGSSIEKRDIIAHLVGNGDSTVLSAARPPRKCLAASGPEGFAFGHCRKVQSRLRLSRLPGLGRTCVAGSSAMRSGRVQLIICRRIRLRLRS